MKKIFFLFLVSLTLLACKDETSEQFRINNIDELKLRFEPYDGGATLHYTLPTQNDIYGIKVLYKTDRGEDMLVRGSYVGKSID